MVVFRRTPLYLQHRPVARRTSTPGSIGCSRCLYCTLNTILAVNHRHSKSKVSWNTTKATTQHAVDDTRDHEPWKKDGGMGTCLLSGVMDTMISPHCERSPRARALELYPHKKVQISSYRIALHRTTITHRHAATRTGRSRRQTRLKAVNTNRFTGSCVELHKDAVMTHGSSLGRVEKGGDRKPVSLYFRPFRRIETVCR